MVERGNGVYYTNMDRRQFIGGMGGLIATSALPGCKTASESEFFAKRGVYERLSVSYAHIHIGLEKPFSVLHISDTHLTAAYDDEPVALCGKAALRTRTFGGRQEAALESSLDWARRNADYVLHTGDLIDFQSRANFDLVRKHYGETVFGPMGNHEFYSYLPDEKHTWQEPFKNRSWSILKDVYPVDARFSSKIVNGVNFVCVDDVFGTVQPDQVEKFHAEAKKGLPIVLAMHVPINTDELWRWAMRFWGQSAGAKYRDAAIPPPRGDYERQLNDPTTRKFVAYLRSEPLLKGLLVGHQHVTMEERFSPTAVQYVVGGNFFFNGREVLFT